MLFMRRCVTTLALALYLILGTVVPAKAWSCDDVRRMSVSEREQAAKALNLTEAQKARIRRACKLEKS